VKELVGYKGKQEPIDLKRLRAIIEKQGYRGVLPFEALGTGDPKEKVSSFLEKIRTAFSLA
jgi:hypothetical protein